MSALLRERQQRKRRRVVFVIDDEEQYQKLIVDSLAGLDIDDIRAVSIFDEAVLFEELREYAGDDVLIFLDQNLHHALGEDILQMLEDMGLLGKRLVVIAHSKSGCGNEILLIYGARDVIKKPASREDYQAIVTGWFDLMAYGIEE